MTKSSDIALSHTPSNIPKRGERLLSNEMIAASFHAIAEERAPRTQLTFLKESRVRALSATEYAAVAAVYLQSGGVIAHYDERPLREVSADDPEAVGDMPVQWLVRRKFQVSPFSLSTSSNYPFNLVIAEGKGEGIDNYHRVIPETDFDEGYFGSVLWFDPGLALIRAASVTTRLAEAVTVYPNVNEILAQHDGQHLGWATHILAGFSREIKAS